MSSKSSQVIIYGSLAYDRVMDFPGRFKENFLANKLHAINVSFAVPTLQEGFGGTAGNISYNLSLLRLKASVIGTVGHDFENYRLWLKKHFVDTKFIKQTRELTTASAFIITDRDDNQITGFYYGAMQVPYLNFFKVLKNEALVAIAPGHSRDMGILVKHCVRQKMPFIYDPGQQITTISPRELKLGVSHAAVFIGNDYEISLVAKKIGVTENSLIKMTNVLIRTLGAKGSEIWQNGHVIKIRAVRPKKVIDPTGAGDAYRAGIIYGLLHKWDWRRTGNLASRIASRAVGKYGTQNHKFAL